MSGHINRGEFIFRTVHLRIFTMWPLATSMGWPYKGGCRTGNCLGVSPGQKKVVVILRWLFYHKAGFHCSILYSLVFSLALVTM